MSASYPSPITTPFAFSGAKNVIPNDDASPLASWEMGFPPITMQPLSSGGVPPAGQDFNGVLNALSATLIWVNAGGRFKYNGGVSAAFGGYSIGMILQSDDGLSEYISIANNNTQNPNTSSNVTPAIGAQWAPYTGAVGDSGFYCIDTGTASDYIVDPQPNDGVNHHGMSITFKALNSSTGASTLNAGGGAAALKRSDGSPLAAGDILAGAIYTAVFDGDTNSWFLTSAVNSQSAIPSGTVMQFAGASAPSGYLICDGTSYPASSYPALFAAIGTTYGGSGGNFNVPDLAGKFPLGAEAGPFPLASVGGSATHTLTLNEIPAHRHVDPYSESSSTVNGFASVAGVSSQQGSNSTDVDNVLHYGGYEGGTGYADSTHADAPSTVCSPHTNMPPYVALNYIIKV